MKELTKAEEQVMHYLWKIEKGFLKDILRQFPEPKPAHNTVSTVLKALKKKGFVAYNTYGKIHEYYPVISKNAYFKTTFKGLLTRYFGSSVKRFASFFSMNSDLSLSELEEVKKIIEDQIKRQQADD